jgi:hypothetical protein
MRRGRPFPHRLDAQEIGAAPEPPVTTERKSQAYFS